METTVCVELKDQVGSATGAFIIGPHEAARVAITEDLA